MAQVPHDARFAVVACSGCHHARGVDLTAQTTTCGRCGARARTESLRVFYATGDPDELGAAVGVVEARLGGGETAVADVAALREAIAAARERRSVAAAPRAGAEDAEVVAFAASRAAGVVSNARKAERIMEALDLYGPKAGFTPDMVEQAFVAAGLPATRADEEIRRALVQDRLYEPRPGRLRLMRDQA